MKQRKVKGMAQMKGSEPGQLQGPELPPQAHEVTTATKGRHGTARRASRAAMVGSTVEMYDFAIYGTAAAIVFPQLFFSNQEPLVGTLLAFATFGAGFVARVLGSAVIGHFGDRIGRKSMLVMTLVAVGLATFAIGLLPTYAAIGVWAPLLLVALRVAQGFFFGGEHGGAMLIAVEHAPQEKRGYFGSLAMVGSPLGVLLATGSFLGARAISGDQFMTWGWRLPFLASIFIIGVGFVIRLGLPESPDFVKVRESKMVSRVPLAEAFRGYWRNIALVASVVLCATASTYLLIAFLISYLTTALGLPEALGLTTAILGSVVMALAMIGSGWLSDRLGQRKVIVTAAAVLAVYAFPFFWLLELRNPGVVLIAIAVSYTAAGAVWGPTAALFNSLFPVRVRYSGVSMGYQIGSVLGGGFTPVIATALLHESGGATWPIALYLIAMSLVAIGAVSAIRERSSPDHSGEPA